MPLYALETDIKDHPPAQLASVSDPISLSVLATAMSYIVWLLQVLGMDALTQFPLRVPNNSDPQARRLRARRRRWKMDTENRVPAPENDSADEANAGKKTRAMQRELKLSRQEVTNIGCGYLAVSSVLIGTNWLCQQADSLTWCVRLCFKVSLRWWI